jgi:hypothetical protein
VTSGVGCNANPLNITTGPAFSRKEFKECTWAARLEHIINHAFFGGEKRVEVFNLATPGSSSEVAAIVMEYHLFDNKSYIPYIVLSAHSANDHKEGVNRIQQMLQDYVQAAHKLRPCDDDLPLVVMIDDFYAARTHGRAVEHGGVLYTVASWYNLMLINYASVVRNRVVGNSHNETAVKYLTGGTYNIHLGMGLHIGMAWTVLYNIMDAVVNTCTEIVDNPTVETLVADEPPSKHIGRIETDITKLVDEWEESVANARSACSTKAKSANRLIPDACTYAWMVSRATKVSTRTNVFQVLRPVLKSNDGWAAQGFPVKQPRSGWYAKKENATFSLEIKNISVETNYFTVLSMKSYGPNFVGAKLHLTLRVIHEQSSIENDETEKSYVIDGYHSTITSVHVPHKVQLPGSGANVGDTIILEAKLVGASSFKIAGLAFCTD